MHARHPHSTTLGATTSSYCQFCAAGTYQTASAATLCINCTAGTSSGSIGAHIRKRLRCAGAGTFQGVAGQAACSACAANTFSLGGATACTSCLAGSASVAGSAACSCLAGYDRAWRSTTQACSRTSRPADQRGLVLCSLTWMGCVHCVWCGVVGACLVKLHRVRCELVQQRNRECGWHVLLCRLLHRIKRQYFLSRVPPGRAGARRRHAKGMLHGYDVANDESFLRAPPRPFRRCHAAQRAPRAPTPLATAPAAPVRARDARAHLALPDGARADPASSRSCSYLSRQRAR